MGMRLEGGRCFPLLVSEFLLRFMLDQMHY